MAAMCKPRKRSTSSAQPAALLATQKHWPSGNSITSSRSLATFATQRSTSRFPIAFLSGSDPVAFGLVESIAPNDERCRRPGLHSDDLRIEPIDARHQLQAADLP